MPNKVLLIDDDEMMHLIGTRLIEKSSFANETILLSNGKEGIDYFQNIAMMKEKINKEDIPDFILLDINMPIMDGWEFLKYFSEIYSQVFPTIKIAILSSSVDPEDLERSKKSPLVVEYLVKPLTIENLQNLSISLKNE